MLFMAFKDWSAGGAFIFSFPLTLPIVGIISIYLLIIERRSINEYVFFALFGIAHFISSPFILEIFISGDTQLELTESLYPDLIVLFLYILYILFAIFSITKFNKSVSKWITIASLFGFMVLIFLNYEAAYILYFSGLSVSHLLNREWKPFDQLIYILTIGKALEYLSYFFASFFF